MVEKEVTFVLKAVDEASPVLDALKAKMDEVERSLNVYLPAAVNGANKIPTAPSTPTEATTTSAVVPNVKKSAEEVKNTMQMFADALKESLNPKVFDFSNFNSKGFDKVYQKQQADERSKTMNIVQGSWTPTQKAIDGWNKEIMKGMTPKTVPDKKSSGDKSQETMISTEQANFFRALGQYRIAWLGKLKTEGGDGVSGGMVKLAAGFVILQAIADGIQKIVSILAEASPLLRAEIKVLKIAIGEFLRPIGDLLGTVLRPISFAMLKSNAFARSTMAKEGIKQTDLGEYYSRFFASMANETLGLNMSEGGMLALADGIEVAGKTYLASMTGIAGVLALTDWDQMGEDLQELQAIWDAIKITPGDVETLTTGLKNMVSPVNILNNAFTNLATPIQSLSNILNSIPGIGGGSGGNSTLNMGGINIVNNIVGGARDVAEGIGSGIEDGINVARGWTK